METWQIWALIIVGGLITDGFLYWLFDFYIFCHILRIILEVAGSGKDDDSFGGGGGSFGGGGSSDSF